MAAFALIFSIRKEFLKKIVHGEIAFALISFSMYKYKSLQAGKLTWKHLSFFQNLLNFFITKYLQEVDDDLTIYMDECSPCGLSITRDIKIYQCHMIKR